MIQTNVTNPARGKYFQWIEWRTKTITDFYGTCPQRSKKAVNKNISLSVRIQEHGILLYYEV
ncbi:hypothetical protein NXX38_16960 [Bacteroides sp. BFG-637]|uniref:hypothetical protein n=1 Tax=Bacteroides sp. BFG-637 TaxID=2972764 RepID=UPI002165E8BA|nr:hypothetical protein [Bacteroides sp. BFG-637]MCS3313491.1 hypothetical protein [Bacteroides sp. BFG-637]